MHQIKKRFGQNFIKDTNLINKIIDVSEIDDKNVLEVGPGRGALTKGLINRSNKYLAYEIDYSLKPILSEYETNKSTIIFNDFLKEDISEMLSKYFNNEEVHLVGNLPYNITTPIIFKFLEIEQLKSATIMVQKEVGERMISKTNLKSYSGFSAILQYYTNVTSQLIVNKKMFYPIPKVDSMVVKLTKIPSRLTKEEEKIYEKIVKVSFAQKRKTLVNNLSSGLNISKDIVTNELNILGINDNIRAETLGVSTFIDITKAFMKYIV